MQVWGPWGSPNLHILKKIRSFVSEKSPTLHILKKIKKIKNQFIYANQSPHRVWDFWFFLSICRFGDFSLSKLLIFLSICRFCARLASKCWFFLSICRLGEPPVSHTYIFATFIDSNKHFHSQQLSETFKFGKPTGGTITKATKLCSIRVQGFIWIL